MPGARAQILWRITVLVSFLHLKLKREPKEDHRRVGEAKWGLDYKIVCFLKGDYVTGEERFLRF